MVLRQLNINECWCLQCTEGQMNEISDIITKEEIALKDLQGRSIRCKRCGYINTITSVIQMVVLSYGVTNQDGLTKVNEDLKNWLNE